MKIAVVTQDPDHPITTYIRQHMRTIAPGNTVSLYFSGAGKSVTDIPSLRVPSQSRSFPVRRLEQIRSFIGSGYPGAIAGRARKEVGKFFIQNQVAAVLAEFGPTGCALAPLCRSLGIRLVVNFHGYDATVMPKRWIIRHAYHRLRPYVDALVCGSEHFAGTLVELGFDRNRIAVIPCGIEIEEFNATQKKDPNLLVAVGRFVEKKAPHLTIQAFSQLRQQFPDARLEMIGDGPLRQQCEDLVASENLGDRVVFHGAQPHDFVKKLLARASLFLQHSVTAANGDTESQGISLLEAMASGISVVATRHNGFTETVSEGETGYLVDEGDVAAMASRISDLLANPTLASRMGSAGRSRIVAQFLAADMAVKLRTVLKYTPV